MVARPADPDRAARRSLACTALEPPRLSGARRTPNPPLSGCRPGCRTGSTGAPGRRRAPGRCGHRASMAAGPSRRPRQASAPSTSVAHSLAATMVRSASNSRTDGCVVIAVTSRLLAGQSQVVGVLAELPVGHVLAEALRARCACRRRRLDDERRTEDLGEVLVLLERVDARYQGRSAACPPSTCRTRSPRAWRAARGRRGCRGTPQRAGPATARYGLADASPSRSSIREARPRSGGMRSIALRLSSPQSISQGASVSGPNRL